MASTSKVLLLLLVGLSAIIDGGVSSNVGELQRERWREKLPEVAMPQTLVERLSPLSVKQMQSFAAGLKNLNAASFDAHQFCRSAGLMCSDDVALPLQTGSKMGARSTELMEIKKLVFFDKKELRESGKIILPDFSPPNYLTSFLPIELAEMMPPFSSANVSQIMKMLKISKESSVSRRMGSTLEMCEKRAEEGEVKKCSTSFEGMKEYVVSLLGSDLELYTDTSVVGSGEEVSVRKVSKRENVVVGGKAPVTCHEYAFPYGASYCHSSKGIEVFDVELEAVEDNKKVKRNVTALCHYVSNGYQPACHPIYGQILFRTPKPKLH